MGDVQSIPVVGETVTAIQSGTKLAAAGVCGIVGGISDDQDIKDMGSGLLQGAGDSWVQYSERSLVAGTVNAAIHDIGGNRNEADRIAKKVIKSLEGVADNTPGVGHIKGVVHYATGDKAHGHRCMLGASRSTAVLGAGVLTGGLGAGVALGATAGVVAGVEYDLVVSGVSKKSSGVVAGIEETCDALESRDPSRYINSVVDTTLSIAGDAATGAAGAKMGQNMRTAYEIRRDNNFLTEKMGPDGARNTRQAAKNVLNEINDGNLKEQGKYTATVVEDTNTGKTSTGLNRSAAKQKHVSQMQQHPNGCSQGQTHTSNNSAKNCGSLKPSRLLESQRDATPALQRPPNACAEQAAFEATGVSDLQRGEMARFKTHTVRVVDGRAETIPRCENCANYDMGDVPTDRVPQGTHVPTSSAGRHFADGAKAGGAAVALTAAKRGRSKRQSQD